MRTLLTLVFVILRRVANSTAAQAHAFLDHASPLVGSTVPTAPHEVALWFTQNLEPAFSTVEVTDGSGARVDHGKAQISGNTMRIGLKALGAGSYNVHWHALSVDTHTTEGSFTFHVGGSLDLRRSAGLSSRAIHFAATHVGGGRRVLFCLHRRAGVA